MTQPQPPLLDEVEKYLKWEYENGLSYVEMAPFVPPEIPVTAPVADNKVDKSPVSEMAPSNIVADARPGSVLPRLSVPGRIPAVEAPAPNGNGAAIAQAMARLRREWVGCTRCPLCQKRHNFVFGEGNLQPRLLFVGEGPGENEDLQGRPFVGKAGELLTNLIKAMGLRRELVFITNIVKCRPPNNRDPQPDEVAACNPLLQRQIALLHPEVMVALGKPAAHLLLNSTAPISKLRGHWYDYHGIPLLPTFHPAYLLRNPADKGLIWADMCQVLVKLGLPVPSLGRKSRS